MSTKVRLNGGYATVHNDGHYYWVYVTGQEHAEPKDCLACLAEGKAPEWLKWKHKLFGCGKGPFWCHPGRQSTEPMFGPRDSSGRLTTYMTFGAWKCTVCGRVSYD